MSKLSFIINVYPSLEKKMKRLKLVVPVIFSLFVISNISQAEPTVTEIMNKQDKMLNFGLDFSAKIKFVVEKVNKGFQQTEALVYRRDTDDAFLTIVLDPSKDRGNGILRVGDNFWLYLRNTRTFQHINRDEKVFGTGFQAQMLEARKISELYKPVKDDKGNEIITKGKLGNVQIYMYELVAKVKDVAYPKEVFYVRQDNFLPLKVDHYSLSGNSISTDYFLKYTRIEGHYIPIKCMNIDKFEKGNKSMMEISKISLSAIDDAIFTKAHLENISK